MNLYAMIVAALIGVPGLSVPANVAAAEPVTAGQFAQRCTTSADFCKRRISLEIALLERSRTACLPGSVSRESATAKIRSLFDDVLEEDPETFRATPYQPVIRQIAAFLWPCEPIS